MSDYYLLELFFNEEYPKKMAVCHILDILTTYKIKVDLDNSKSYLDQNYIDIKRIKSANDLIDALYVLSHKEDKIDLIYSEEWGIEFISIDSKYIIALDENKGNPVRFSSISLYINEFALKNKSEKKHWELLKQLSIETDSPLGLFYYAPSSPQEIWDYILKKSETINMINASRVVAFYMNNEIMKTSKIDLEALKKNYIIEILNKGIFGISRGAYTYAIRKT